MARLENYMPYDIVEGPSTDALKFCKGQRFSVKFVVSRWLTDCGDGMLRTPSFTLEIEVYFMEPVGPGFEINGVVLNDECLRRVCGYYRPHDDKNHGFFVCV